MKREMDLVRSILVEVADSDCPLDASALTDERHDFQSVAYHVDIMAQAGLLNANIRKGLGGEYVLAEAQALTWEGQDLLAAITADEVWAEVKRTIDKRLGDAELSTVKAIAIETAKTILMG